MEVVEPQPQRLEVEKNSPKSPVGRHSFFIQDILSPEFGNKQLKDQYYAYLHYYYSLHVQNVMIMQNQHQLQRLQKEKVELETAGLNFDGSLLSKGHHSPPSVPIANIYSQHADRVIRPTPRSLKIPNVHGLNLKNTDILHHQSPLKSSPIGINTSKNSYSSSSISKADPLSPSSASDKSPSSASLSSSFLHHSSPESSRVGGVHGDSSATSPRVSESGSSTKDGGDSGKADGDGNLWPAWVYCTRYSDRPSSGRRARKNKQNDDDICPRSRKIKRKQEEMSLASPASCSSMEKRPRIAFTNEQLASLKREFDENRYLTEERRAKLAAQLDLTESQVKIWFQNKRAKLKKSSGVRNPLALQLMQQGLYNHATVPTDTDDHSDME